MVPNKSHPAPYLPQSLKRQNNFPDLKTVCDCTAVGNEVVKRKKSARTHLKNTYIEHPGLFFVWSERHISSSRFLGQQLHCSRHRGMGTTQALASRTAELRTTFKTLQPSVTRTTRQGWGHSPAKPTPMTRVLTRGKCNSGKRNLYPVTAPLGLAPFQHEKKRRKKENISWAVLIQEPKAACFPVESLFL